MNATKIAMITALAGFTFTAQAADSPVKLGGFVDAQGIYTKVDPEANNTGVAGWEINDGAIYLSSQMGETKFMLDLPFAYTATSAAGSNNNDFSWAQDKAQAYMDWNQGNWGFTLGQFDTPFGFEVNDSIGNTFTSQGLLYASSGTPVTHTGIMVHADLGVVTAKAIVSNSANQGNKNADNFELGGQLSYAQDNMRGSFGYVYLDLGAKVRHYVNFMAGATFDKIAVDAEFNILKNNTVATTDTGYGFLLNGVFSATEDMNLAAKFEMGKKLPSNYSTWLMAFGPQYAVNSAMKLKADYTLSNVEATNGATEIKTHTVAVAGQYSF